MADSFASFARKLDKLTAGLRDPQLRKVMDRLGDDAQDIARREASSDLGGDPKFSGWKPPLDTQVKHLGEGRIQLRPTGSSAGPWTVAQSGRNQGNASGFAGPGINTRTGLTSRTKSGGLRKVRGRKGRRWNGRTRGKGTSDRTHARIERDMPDRLEKHVRDQIRKAGLR